MPTLHVSTGDRTYLPGKDVFADVTRDHVLGLGKGCVVRSDDGRLRAFCGGNASTVVAKGSGLDGDGNAVAVPTDVKAVGPGILTQFGVTASDQVALFQKFIVLEPAVRNEKAALWEEHQYDEAALSTFIPEVIGILQSDDAYIAAQANKILGHVSAQVRGTMLSTLMQVTDQDTRKGLIVNYTLIQNDKTRVEAFMQSVYLLVLDNDTYMAIEMRRALLTLKGMDSEQADTRIAAFVENTTQDIRNEFVAAWRSLRYYTKASRKAGVRKVLHLLAKYNA